MRALHCSDGRHNYYSLQLGTSTGKCRVEDGFGAVDGGVNDGDRVFEVHTHRGGEMKNCCYTCFPMLVSTLWC